MKKLISLLLCAVLALALCMPAMADIIWEPDDDFYMEHRDECARVESDYEAVSAVNAMKSPVERKTAASIETGTVVYISYVWHGEHADWGYTENYNGWVPLNFMRRLYNAADFAAEHAEEFVERAGSVSRAEHDTICFYTFPGSGEIEMSIAPADFDWAEDDPAYYEVWTDAEGREWGHVGYYYAIRGWVCLSDPEADDLPADAPYYAEPAPDISDTSSDSSSAAPAGLSLAATLVIIVMAVTAVIISAGFMRKEKQAR